MRTCSRLLLSEVKLDFGARQVIITRDESARTELRKTLGDAGLILTLLESKGSWLYSLILRWVVDEP